MVINNTEDLPHTVFTMELQVERQPKPIAESEDLKKLKEHHDEIKQWINSVQSKIYELETSYLEETQLGNIIKGWEIDGRPPLKLRGQCEEKERLFSFSSYEVWQDHKTQQLDNVQNSKVTVSVKQKKNNRKRKVEILDDWNQAGDY